MTCIVPSCRMRRCITPNVRFFRVPKKKTVSFSKIIFDRDDTLSLYKEPRICEQHFENKYILKSGLHSDAVPTLRLADKSFLSNSLVRFLKRKTEEKKFKLNIQPSLEVELTSVETIHSATSNQPVPVHLNDHNSNDECAVNEDDNCANDDCGNGNCSNEEEEFTQEDDNSCSETDDKETINILLSLFEKEVEKHKILMDENIRLRMELEKTEHI